LRNRERSSRAEFSGNRFSFLLALPDGAREFVLDGLSIIRLILVHSTFRLAQHESTRTIKDFARQASMAASDLRRN